MRKQDLKGLESICEAVMRNRFIFPSEARLTRFDVANCGKKTMSHSAINPAICTLGIMLSSGYMGEAGYK
jgi:hypothetical protein